MSHQYFQLWHPEFAAWFERLCINEKTMRGVVWPGLIINSQKPLGKTMCLCYAEHFISKHISSSVLYIDEPSFFADLAQKEGTAAFYEALQLVSHVEWLLYDNLLDSDYLNIAGFPFDALEFIIRTRSDRYLPTIFSTRKFFSEMQEILPLPLTSPLSELKRLSLYANKLRTDDISFLMSKELSTKKEVVA